MSTKWAYGAVVKEETSDGSGVYEIVAKLKRVRVPDVTTDEWDATTHGSEKGFEELIPTIHRTGVVQVMVVYDNDEHLHRRWAEDQEDRVYRRRLVEFPNGTRFKFMSWVKRTGHPSELTEGLQLEADFRVTGRLQREVA